MSIKEKFDALSEQEKDTLKSLHLQLQEITEHPEQYTDPVQLIEDIEYVLQQLWKFTRDASRHTHWIRIKGCKCPLLDNKDRWGYGRVVNGDCPWHGVKYE